MNYTLINTKNGNEIDYERRLVFSKLLQAYGPKRWSENASQKWMKAYLLAIKDFQEIYGITPAIRWKGRDKQWNNIKI